MLLNDVASTSESNVWHWLFCYTTLIGFLKSWILMRERVKLTAAELTGNKYYSRGILAITETNQTCKNMLVR
mgnify:CR=1 FL=1